MGFSSTTSSSTRLMDNFIFTYLPKVLMGLILVILLFFSRFYSERISYIFSSDLSLQQMFSLSIDFYLLSIVTIIFLVIWIATITRSTLNFCKKIFSFEPKSKLLDALFKTNVLFLSLTVYIYLDFFLPDSYLLTGTFFFFKALEDFLALQFTFFPSIVSIGDYSSFTSLLLLFSLTIICLIFFVTFVFHLIYYYLKKNNLDDFFAWNYTFQISKTVLFCLIPFLVLYLLVFYDSIPDIIVRLTIISIVLLLVLWFVYKITSTYYYGVTDSFISDEFGTNIFILILVFFYVIPFILWYILDFYDIYVMHTIQHTVILDFKGFLLSNGTITTAMLSKPYTIDPYVLLFLSMIAIPRIILLDVSFTILLGLAILIKMQYRYIVTYFRSKFNQDFKTTFEVDHETIARFNTKIQKSILLHILFILFIAFLVWDVVIVIFNTFIVPLDPSIFPDLSHVIIITVLLSYITQLQLFMIDNGIFFLIILFLAVLVVFNVVSVKLNEQGIEKSSFGTISLLSVSFILINAFLLYDLQNYLSRPLLSFKPIVIASFIFYSYKWFITVVVFCDSLFFIYTFGIFAKRINKRIQRYLEEHKHVEAEESTMPEITEEKELNEETSVRQELENEEI